MLFSSFSGNESDDDDEHFDDANDDNNDEDDDEFVVDVVHKQDANVELLVEGLSSHDFSMDFGWETFLGLDLTLL